MRVLHVTDTYLPRRGGIELHVHDLAHAQRQAGDDVDILTVTCERGVSPAEPTDTLLRPIAGAGVRAKTRFIQEHRRCGLQGDYDVVHAHCSTMSPLVFATLAVAQVPTAVTVHSLWRRYTPLYRAGDFAVGWSRWPVAWSAVSEAAAQAVRASAKGPLVVDVVPNGIDLSAWSEVAHTPGPGGLRVTSVMRLAPRKRPLALLRILRNVAEAMPADRALHAVIVGDGPQAPAMRRYIRRHRMERVVTLAGHLPRPEIARRLACTDVFVAPARLESFGIAALEAAAAGVPVLGRAGTGLSEFVANGTGGLLLDSDAAIARALVTFARDPSTLTRAEPRALARTSWPAVVARTRELYRRAGVDDAVATAATGRQAS